MIGLKYVSSTTRGETKEVKQGSTTFFFVLPPLFYHHVVLNTSYDDITKTHNLILRTFSKLDKIQEYDVTFTSSKPWNVLGKIRDEFGRKTRDGLM